MRLFDRFTPLAPLAVFLVFIAFLATLAPRESRADASTREDPLGEWAGALALGETFCITVGATPVNLTAPASWTAPVQARLTTARLGQMRYLSVKLHSTPGTTCIAPPGTSPGAAMTCAPATTPDTTGFPLYNQGDGTTVLLDRTKAVGGITGALPAVYAVSSGAGGVLCLAFSGGVQ